MKKKLDTFLSKVSASVCNYNFYLRNIPCLKKILHTVILSAVLKIRLESVICRRWKLKSVKYWFSFLALCQEKVNIHLKEATRMWLKWSCMKSVVYYFSVQDNLSFSSSGKIRRRILMYPNSSAANSATRAESHYDETPSEIRHTTTYNLKWFKIKLFGNPSFKPRITQYDVCSEYNKSLSP